MVAFALQLSAGGVMEEFNAPPVVPLPLDGALPNTAIMVLPTLVNVAVAELAVMPR